MKKCVRRACFTLLGLVLAILVACLGLYWWSPVPALKGRWVYSPMNSSLQRTTGLEEESLLRLGDISGYLLIAVLTNEDGNFLIHSGLDFRELRRAVSDTLLRGRRLRGASTISQQLVKNVFLSKERRLSRKFLEAVYAVRLENEFEKEDILSLYLNVAQFGAFTYGVDEAARIYFDKRPRDLDIEEAALLVMLLPEPEGRGRRLQAGELNSRDRGLLRRLLLRTHAVLDHLQGHPLNDLSHLSVFMNQSFSDVAELAESRSYSKEVRTAAARSLGKIDARFRRVSQEAPR